MLTYVNDNLLDVVVSRNLQKSSQDPLMKINVAELKEDLRRITCIFVILDGSKCNCYKNFLRTDIMATYLQFAKDDIESLNTEEALEKKTALSFLKKWFLNKFHQSNIMNSGELNGTVDVPFPEKVEDRSKILLAFTAFHAHIQVVRRTLEAFNVLQRNTPCGTRLYLETLRGNEEMLKKLLQCKTKVETSGYYQCTPLHVCAYAGNVNLTSMLLDANADPNARDRNGLTPLHLSTLSGAVAVTEMLLEAKADPNIVDNRMESPLHIAVLMRDLTMIRLLMQHGAKVEMPNRWMFTPHFLASVTSVDTTVFLSRNILEEALRGSCAYDVMTGYEADTSETP